MHLILAAALLLPWGQSEQNCEGLPETYAVWCDDENKLNGYWWAGYWVPGMVSVESWFTPAPEYSVGRAVWYAPGMMPDVPEPFIGGVAMMSCADVGQSVWLHRPGNTWEGPFLVVDCAQGDDIYAIVQYRREVVEVGWQTKERWGIDQPLDGVEVMKAADAMGLWRRLEAADPAVDYPSWWLARATFTNRWEPRPLLLRDGCWRLGGPGGEVTCWAPRSGT